MVTLDSSNERESIAAHPFLLGVRSISNLERKHAGSLRIE